MKFSRSLYLDKLVSSIGNGMIKVITGPRRSGKSYLLIHIFREWLREHGVPDDRIFMMDLSDDRNDSFRNPLNLGQYLRSVLPTEGQAFLFIDEIQLCESIDSPAFEGYKTSDGHVPQVTFYSVLNGILSSYSNVEVFVTGSNSRMLSSDIATEFRGRGWQIHMHPLSFREIREQTPASVNDFELWDTYWKWGGLPGCAVLSSEEEKRQYLSEVYQTTYLKDIVDRYSLRNESSFSEITSFLASAVGSLINPNKLSNAFQSKEKTSVCPDTIRRYFDYMEDAFLVSKTQRYDLKGKAIIGGQAKYYFQDLGLRNAASGFKGMDQEPHCMENVIYNELRLRGYQVNVGVVTSNEFINGKQVRVSREVDFVVETSKRRFYIQTALYLQSEEKVAQEKASLLRIGDGFNKIIITKFTSGISSDEDGTIRLGLFDFLKSPTILDGPIF